MSCQISVLTKLPAVSGTIARISMKGGGSALYLRAITRPSFLQASCLLLFRFQSSVRCVSLLSDLKFTDFSLAPPTKRNSIFFYCFFLSFVLAFFFFRFFFFFFFFNTRRFGLFHITRKWLWLDKMIALTDHRLNVTLSRSRYFRFGELDLYARVRV